MTPARLVVRVPNWLGDVAMALPALGAVRAGLGTGHLALAGPAAFAELLAAVPGVDEVVRLPVAQGLARVRAFREGRAARRRPVRRRAAPDELVRHGVAGRAVGHRGAVGLRRRPPGAVADARRAAAWSCRRGRLGTPPLAYYLRLVEALGFPLVDAGPPRLACPPALRDRGLRILCERGACLDRPVIGLAPGAAFGHAKRWPPELAAALVAQIVARTSAVVAVVGAAGDRDTARQLQSSIVKSGVVPAGRVLDLVGQTSLGELLGVIAACRAFVSNDSGVMHLSAALGVPVVAVFGPTDEHATAPLGPHRVVTAASWCRPCQLRECPIDHHCMRGIAPTAVFAALADVLAA